MHIYIYVIVADRRFNGEYNMYMYVYIYRYRKSNIGC